MFPNAVVVTPSCLPCHFGEQDMAAAWVHGFEQGNGSSTAERSGGNGRRGGNEGAQGQGIHAPSRAPGHDALATTAAAAAGPAADGRIGGSTFVPERGCPCTPSLACSAALGFYSGERSSTWDAHCPCTWIIAPVLHRMS